jgi:hypothetical protein
MPKYFGLVQYCKYLASTSIITLILDALGEASTLLRSFKFNYEFTSPSTFTPLYPVGYLLIWQLHNHLEKAVD